MSNVMKVYKEFDNFYDFVLQQYVERYELISIKSIARRLGCATPTIYRWQQRGPRSIAILEPLAKDLDCTIDQLMIINKYYLDQHQEEVK